MQPTRRRSLLDLCRTAFLATIVVTSTGAAVPISIEPAAALRARHEDLQGALANNAFDRPMYIESKQRAGDASGDVFARVEHSFESVSNQLQQSVSWCDILILHVNIKQCITGTGLAGESLGVHVGRKSGQSLSDAYHLDFQYRVVAASQDYLHVELSAAQGPLGTRDYRISFEAVPVDAQHSFIHISYSYGQGLAARLATRGYLATAGSSKVGFSVVGHRDGQPVLVREMRGMVERNAMRYYLAVEAFLDALALPESERTEKRLRDWYEATEQYARQLRDLERHEYLKMKRDEVERQEESQSQS
jgi:hypothetical protein